jgi:hypothetical protein
MQKSDVIAVLPEFSNVDETEFNALIDSASAVFPNDEYVDENLAKVYFVARFYFESIKRMKTMENMGIQSEKIDDIQIIFKDNMNEINPYDELFKNMVVSNHLCDVAVGFMVSE